MSDPFSVTVGSLSLADIAGKVSNRLSTHVNSLKHASSGVLAVINELNNIKVIVHRVEGIYLSLSTHYVTSNSDSNLQGLVIAVLGRAKLCINNADQLTKAFGSGLIEGNLGERVNWVNSKSKTIALLTELRQIRGDLQIILSLDIT